MDIKEDLFQWFLNFVLKRPASFGLTKIQKIPKTNFRKLKKLKVRSSFKDNIWGAHLADMKLISKFILVF